MSSGIRRPKKKPSGAAGLRAAAPRPGQPRGVAGARSGPKPPTADANVPATDTRASTDYTLMSATRKRTHNVMRFLSERTVDLETFAAPVKMRRRNREYYRLKNKKRNEERMAQQQQQEQELQQSQPQGGAGAAGMMQREERPKVDINLIADAGGARRNKRNLFKKRTKQVFFANEDKRRLDIEEARPWVLEDDDEKEVWTGTLEGGQSSSYVLFVLADDGFKVVPVDRWYKFAPKLNYKALTLDEAEEELLRQRKGNATHDRWLMHRRNPKTEDGDADAGQDRGEPSRGSSLVEYEVEDIMSDNDDGDGEDEGAGAGKAKKKSRSGGKHGGTDEVAFEMEFDDDEEMGDVCFEFNEEEANERKEQISKGQVGFFGSDDEDEDAEGGSSGVADGKAVGGVNQNVKKMRKLIRKREGIVGYESDREVNPYLSESDVESDDSDEEEAAANQDEQQDQQQQQPSDEKPADGTGAPPAGPQQTTPRPDGQPPAPGSSGVKKRKRVSVAPHAHAHKGGHPSPPPAASPSAAGSAPSGSGDARKHFRASSPKAAGASSLITKQEIVDLIRSGVSTTKDLIGHVRKKLKADPENKTRIHTILKEVATFKNNHLSLKKP
ncbi:transcription factor IIF subunit tfg1 [Coemansia biformis]|uniref:Transcription initiation factor IIF subunit alpha n=1 Tax=Coemansia biformis TaxID=1286918 RepID=A0A9W7YC53_9FUNG|nr:transcription factor IIF subunit tfg1 [Coemansia biformis]